MPFIELYTLLLYQYTINIQMPCTVICFEHVEEKALSFEKCRLKKKIKEISMVNWLLQH